MRWTGLYKIGRTMYAFPMWVIKTFFFLFACYAAVSLWVFMSQRRLVYVPSRTMTATPADIGMEYEEVWLTNRLGTRIHAWWLPCENARFTLLFSHGNGGNVSHRLESFRIFHGLGLSVMIYDYSGYGLSEGEPGEKETSADVRAAWDWLVSDKNIAPESIILFGRSLGGAVAAGLAGELWKEGVFPAGLIVESSFSSAPDIGAHFYPWLPVRQLARFRYDSVSNLADVRLDALFAHSPEDDIVPYELGQSLYSSYPGPKSFFELSGDHNTGYLRMGQDYADGLGRYLNRLETEQTRD